MLGKNREYGATTNIVPTQISARDRSSCKDDRPRFELRVPVFHGLLITKRSKKLCRKGHSRGKKNGAKSQTGTLAWPGGPFGPQLAKDPPAVPLGDFEPFPLLIAPFHNPVSSLDSDSM